MDAHDYVKTQITSLNFIKKQNITDIFRIALALNDFILQMYMYIHSEKYEEQ